MAQFRDDDIRNRLLEVDLGKRLVLILYLVLLCFVLACGLFPATWTFMTLSERTDSLYDWVLLLLGVFLVFCYGYLLGLLFLRIIIPKPKPGVYPTRPDGRPPVEAILFMVNTLLVKLRYSAPFGPMLPSVLVRLPPLALPYRYLFGPDTRSTNLGDTFRILDPYLVKAGKNVQFGFGCTILAHFFDNRGLMIHPVEIGDYTVIGAEAWISPGVRIGQHSLIGVRSVVMPNTEIGDYEYWSGNPAKKVKDLKRTGLKVQS